MDRNVSLSHWLARTGAAVAVAALLAAGAAGNGSPVQSSVAHASTVTTPIAHPIAAGRDSYADVVNLVTPGVVTVRTEGKAKVSPTQFQMPDDDLFRRFFGDRFDGEDAPRARTPRAFKQQGLGSGVVATTDGYILTNNHVVEGADKITIELNDGRTLAAKLIGTDKASDLALLKAEGRFTAVALGNSDAVSVGDVVLAVGNPLGVGQTVTMGIVSAKGRATGVGDGSYEDFLQTDAPINQGNSGGALVNMKGELVGINSQILSNSNGNIGIGFAIPVNMAKNVMEQLRTSGKVTRAQLGVTIQRVTSDMAKSLGMSETRGAIISSVTDGSAADRAGLKQGDVILSFNGQSIHDTNALRNRVAATRPGTEAEVRILRDGAEKDVHVKLEALNAGARARAGREESRDSAEDQTALGVSVSPVTPQMAAKLGKDAHGLVVQSVDPDGRAADAGIHEGDIIQSANRQPVKTVDDLRDALKRSTGSPALLLINRDGHNIFVTVRPSLG
jgi:serine protease Do